MTSGSSQLIFCEAGGAVLGRRRPELVESSKDGEEEDEESAYGRNYLGRLHILGTRPLGALAFGVLNGLAFT